MKIKRIIIAALCMFGLFFGLCLGIGFTAVYSACARTEDEELVDFIVEVETGRDIRVLQLTDPQVIDESQERYQARVGSNWAYGREYIHYERYIKQVINNYKPDFIIVTGDVVYGEFDDSGRALVEYIEFMESFKIPWAPIFGNHDQESNMGADWQCEQFENAEYCLFKQRTLTGNGNYTVGLKQGGELKRVFFMLDSNGCGGASAISMANGHTKTGVGFGNDQIEWYTAAANAIKTKSPSTKLSFAFHIQLQAFADAYEKYGFDNSTTQSNPINIDTHSEKADGDFGYLGRNLKSAWDSDYTVYNGLKALGVDSFFVGHEHCNSASVVYDGIRFQYGQKSSTYDRFNVNNNGTISGGYYGPDGDVIMGGTAIPLSESDGAIVNPYIVYYDAEQEALEQTPTTPVLPVLGTHTFDFNGVDFSAVCLTEGIKALAASAVTDTSTVPSGFTGGVYALKSGNWCAIGIELPRTMNIERVAAFKVRMYVEEYTSTKTSLLRIYDNANNSILAEQSFSNLGGKYDEWVEIDILPLIKSASAVLDENKLLPFSLVYRCYGASGETPTIYFDALAVDYTADVYEFPVEEEVVPEDTGIKPTYAEEAWDVYKGYAYTRYTLLDFDDERLELTTDQRKIYDVGKDSFSIAFDYLPISGGLNVRLLTDEAGKGGYTVRFTAGGFTVIDDKTTFTYAFPTDTATAVEVGLVRLTEDEETGYYNGNTAYIFVKINGLDRASGEIPTYWRLVELWGNDTKRHVALVAFSGATELRLTSWTTIDYRSEKNELLAREISSGEISVTQEKISFYVNGKDYLRVRVDEDGFDGAAKSFSDGAHVVTVTFEELPAPTFEMQNATVELGSARYDGAQHKLSPVVKMGTEVLTVDSDYTVEYRRGETATTNFTDAGEITLVIYGDGTKYIGSITATYTIEKATLSVVTAAQNLGQGEELSSATDKISVEGLVTGDVLSAVVLERKNCKVAVASISLKNAAGADVTANYTLAVTEGESHSFGAWQETKAPTAEEEGESERTCGCGQKQTVKLPKSEAPATEEPQNEDNGSIIGIGVGIGCVLVGGITGGAFYLVRKRRKK